MRSTRRVQRAILAVAGMIVIAGVVSALAPGVIQKSKSSAPPASSTTITTGPGPTPSSSAVTPSTSSATTVPPTSVTSSARLHPPATQPSNGLPSTGMGLNPALLGLVVIGFGVALVWMEERSRLLRALAAQSRRPARAGLDPPRGRPVRYRPQHRRPTRLLRGGP